MNFILEDKQKQNFDASNLRMTKSISQSVHNRRLITSKTGKNNVKTFLYLKRCFACNVLPKLPRNPLKKSC